MAHPLRIEFPGAVYHLISHGNTRQKIYRGNCRRKILFVQALPGAVAMALVLLA